MIYLGLPLCPFEACSLFGLDKSKYDYRRDYYDMVDFVDFTMTENNMKIGFHSTNNMRRFIIGYEINMDTGNVDSFIAQLGELKADFKREIAPLYEKYPDVELYLMNGTNVVVHCPEPYVIEYSCK
jgi:hypothetical protein